MVLTEHRPELSCAHCTGLGHVRPGWAKDVLHRGVKYVLYAAIADRDQFTESCALPAAAADVDPLECIPSSDPCAPPEAL